MTRPLIDFGGEVREMNDVEFAEYEARQNPPPVVVTPIKTPQLFASAGFTIADGFVTSIELAAQLTGAFYDDGWVQVYFADEQVDYLVFATTDIPCKVDQFKATDSFELVFSDANGDPVDPGRIDLQILKVVR